MNATDKQHDSFWESPDEALDWCNQQEDSLAALMKIVAHNLEFGESGFASELCAMSDLLEDCVCTACRAPGLLYAVNLPDGDRIERCDTCERFQSDSEAIQYAFKAAQHYDELTSLLTEFVRDNEKPAAARVRNASLVEQAQCLLTKLKETK